METKALNGIHYAQDEDVTVGGETVKASIYRAYVDNRRAFDVVVPHMAKPAAETSLVPLVEAGKIPAGAACFPIMVRDIVFGEPRPTNGWAVMSRYTDGQGVEREHIDGHSVRGYVMPRMVPLLTKLYVPEDEFTL